MYPMLKEGVELGTFTYEGAPEKHYFISNPDGEEFELSPELFRMLMGADGTHPLPVPPRMLHRLKRNGLVTTSRFVFQGLVNRFILFPVGRRGRRMRAVCGVVNGLLPLVAPVAFAAGMAARAFWGGGYYGFIMPLYAALLLLSIALHEAGHMAAAIAYGYEVTEVGILLLGIFPAGAYVAHRDRKGVAARQRMQLSLAGIECNLLLAGVSLLLSVAVEPLSFTFLLTAYANMVLAAINVLPGKGLDGELALSAAFEVESIYAVAGRCLRSGKARRRLRRAGFAGAACLAIFAATYLATGLVTLLAVADILILVLQVL